MLYYNNFDIDFIERNIEKPWDWGVILYIAGKCNLSIEYIEKYPELNREWRTISSNPNFTMEYIDKHSTKPWVWDAIHMNPFTKENSEFIISKYRRYLSAFKIQRWYHRVRVNPEYRFCRKRVNMFYDKEFI